MRRKLTLLFLIGGAALMAFAYFFLAAPWGTSGVEFSNPRIPFGSTLFLIGVLIALSSAIVYEVYPDRSESSEKA